MMSDTYVSIEEVAKYYSVSVSTVRTWIRTGKLTTTDFLKLGNTYRFKIADVDAALRRVSADAPVEAL
jgi:excisionase family DNA binding protein